MELFEAVPHEVLCLSVVQVADCAVVPAPSEKVWHFLCDSAVLRRASPFFRAALGNCWLEGQTRHVHLPEDAETWFYVLQKLHGLRPRQELPKLCSLESKDMHLLDLRLIEIYQKYLMPDLEHEILEKCRQEEWISEVDEQDMLMCFQQLDFFGVLKENLLSSWCSGLPELMAAPLRDWLRITRDVGVVACPTVAACVASEFFLKQREDMLLLLAELNLLDLLEECASWSWLEEAQLYQLFTEDILMPLTQLSTFRQELRHPRFRQPSLALLLQPFPRLRDDLLDAWFEVPQETKISPEDLAQWASTPEAMPRDLLRRKWQTLTKADFQKFVSLAPDHIFSEDFREDCLLRWHQEEVLPCAPEAEEIYRLWRFQLASSHQLLLWLLCLIWRPCGCPKRVAEKGHHFWRKRKRKRLSVMECCKVLLGLVLEEAHCWLVALQAVIAMDVFLLKVLWHFLRRA